MSNAVKYEVGYTYGVGLSVDATVTSPKYTVNQAVLSNADANVRALFRVRSVSACGARSRWSDEAVRVCPATNSKLPTLTDTTPTTTVQTVFTAFKDYKGEAGLTYEFTAEGVTTAKTMKFYSGEKASQWNAAAVQAYFLLEEIKFSVKSISACDVKSGKSTPDVVYEWSVTGYKVKVNP